MDNQSEVLFSEIKGQQGNIGKITLNRPKVLNALSKAMCQQVDKQLQQWEIAENIKAVVIEGVGDRSFCAGGDIKHFYEMGKAGVDASKDFFWYEYSLNRRIFHFSKPYIALIHGITMGGGVGVSLHGSHRVAAENLIFAMPETSIGFHPDVGVCYWLSRYSDNLGYYLALTGNSINVSDALYIGAVDAMVPKSQFENLIQALAQTPFGANDHASVTQIIKQFERPVAKSVLADYEFYIERYFNQPKVERIIDALIIDNSSWAKETLNVLSKRCPISLKVTLKQLQDSSRLEFDDVIKMDYRLTMQFLHDSNFYEGIRAAIVDKDRAPKWQPAHLDEVGDQTTASYFAPVEKELIVD